MEIVCDGSLEGASSAQVDAHGFLEGYLWTGVVVLSYDGLGRDAGDGSNIVIPWCSFRETLVIQSQSFSIAKHFSARRLWWRGIYDHPEICQIPLDRHCFDVTIQRPGHFLVHRPYMAASRDMLPGPQFQSIILFMPLSLLKEADIGNASDVLTGLPLRRVV